MADRDVEQAADTAADGLRERLLDELAGWSQHITDRLLPVVEAYADAQVAAERALLREWFDWWQNTDDAPAKMPNALHVRTATHLVMADHDPTRIVRGSP